MKNSGCFFTFCLLFCAFAGGLQSQNHQEETANTDQDGADTLTLSDKDTEAIVLSDIGKSYFVENDYSYDVMFERETKIKIISEAGIKWAEIEIPFYEEDGRGEDISDIEAIAYNFEGDRKADKIRLDKSTIYTEKINDLWSVKKFAIPGVKAGTIIKYKYKIKSPYIFNFHDWEFQWKIPVIYSSYEVHMIPFYEYRWVLQGRDKFDSMTSFESEGLGRRYKGTTFNDIIYKYEMKNLPPFDNEEFITSVNDYIIKIDFQLAKITYPGYIQNVIKDWKSLIKELNDHEDFGGYLKRAQKVAPKLLDIKSLLMKSETERFNYIMDYVKANYSWNGHNGKFVTKKLSELLKDKHGSSAELNLLTTGLLKAAGIETYPVIISTRDHGKINTDYPFSHFFNYTLFLSVINGNKMLADVTEVLGQNYRLPARCINGIGLVLNEKINGAWVNLAALAPSETTDKIEIQVREDSKAEARVLSIFKEYDALSKRKEYRENPGNLKKLTDSENYEIVDTTLIVKNESDPQKPFVLHYTTTGKPLTIENKIYLQPFLEKIPTNNPLKQETRSYPVDMIYARKRSFESIIQIPEHAEIDYIPVNFNLDNDLFSMEYAVSSDKEQVRILFNYYFKKAIYSPEEYHDVKAFFEKIISKGNDKIILKMQKEI